MQDLQVRFGILVAAHRKRRNLTQRQLAEAAELSEDMIARIEVGATGSSFASIERIARALAVEPAELFHPQAAAASLVTGELADLLGELAKSTPAEVAWLRRLIQAALAPVGRSGS